MDEEKNIHRQENTQEITNQKLEQKVEEKVVAQENKIYDLFDEFWPIPEPDGKIYFNRSHLHKGALSSRKGGMIILKTEKSSK